jgi:hypothetical protein
MASEKSKENRGWKRLEISLSVVLYKTKATLVLKKKEYVLNSAAVRTVSAMNEH